MKLAIAALALLASAQAPALAFDLMRPLSWLAPSGCSAEVPTIRIGRTEPSVLIDHSKDHRQIDVEARTLKSAVQEGWMTNGLAIARLRTEGESITRETQLQDGRWCVTLSEARFVIGYESPINVFISKRYAKGSCEYDAILRHESQHVEIYEEVLEQHLSGIVPNLVEAIRLSGPAYGKTAASARAAIEGRVNSLISTLADGITTEARQRNGALDTPESYRAVQSQCDGW